MTLIEANTPLSENVRNFWKSWENVKKSIEKMIIKCFNQSKKRKLWHISFLNSKVEKISKKCKKYLKIHQIGNEMLKLTQTFFYWNNFLKNVSK